MHGERPIVIPSRFNGPPASANGGYACGTVARLLGAPAAEVRLRRPVPLDEPLRWDGAALRHGDDAVATGTPLDRLELDVPPPVSVDEAVAASRTFPGFVDHSQPRCFGCGIDRAEGDGLRIFVGQVAGRPLKAAPWTPHPSVAVDGAVPAEVLWAALDCAGGWSPPDHVFDELTNPFLLGTMAGEVCRPVGAGDRLVVSGWMLGREGRKVRAASALHTAGGDLVGCSLQVWIELVARP